MTSGHFLVTGASGFVGKRLVERLLRRGDRVCAVGRREGWAREWRARNDAGLRVFRGDLSDGEFVGRLWREAGSFDGVFHFAAQIPSDLRGEPNEHPLERYVRSNVLATATVLDAASGPARLPLVYSSTISVYGHIDRLPIDEDHPTCPSDRYGVTKLHGEECVRFAAGQGEIRASILRFPGMIGIGNNYGAIHLYTSQILQGDPVSVYGNGAPRKDYIAVDDVVEASLLAMDRTGGFQCEAFNIGGSEPGMSPPTLREVAQMVVEAHGSGTVITNDRKPAEPVHMYFDNLKAHRMLGYSPRLLEDRVREYVHARRVAGARTVHPTSQRLGGR